MRWACWRWWPGRTWNRPRAPTAPTGGGGSPARWRRTGSSPPSIPQARHTRKSKSNRRDGFRGHVAAEPETGLITDAELTKAAGEAGSDPVVGEPMIARDRFHRPATQTPHPDTGATPPPPTSSRPTSPAAMRPASPSPGPTSQRRRARVMAMRSAPRNRFREAPPTSEHGAGLQVYGDSAYGTGEARAAYRAAGHQTVIKPKPLRPAVDGGFTLDDFTVDEPGGTVTCPAGHTRPMSPKRTVTFGRLCAGCPLRARCTTAADGRSMTIHPHEDLLRAARAQARTPQFKQDYPTRSTVERIIAWVATQNGRRVKLRYLGVAKNHAWLRTRCAAINLRTLVNSGLTRATGCGPWPDRPAPQRTLDRCSPYHTGIGGKNDHVVDRTGLTLPHRRPCRRSSRPTACLVQWPPRGPPPSTDDQAQAWAQFVRIASWGSTDPRSACPHFAHTPADYRTIRR